MKSHRAQSFTSKWSNLLGGHDVQMVNILTVNMYSLGKIGASLMVLVVVPSTLCVGYTNGQ